MTMRRAILCILGAMASAACASFHRVECGDMSPAQAREFTHAMPQAGPRS